MNKQIISQTISKSGLILLMFLWATVKIQAAVQYNDTTVNAWCTSALHTLLNDADEGYLSLFTEAERDYFLDTECGSGKKITILSKDEWDDTEVIEGFGGGERTTKNWYRWGVNGSDSGNYAATGVNGFWTKTPFGANTSAYVVSAATGETTTASVTNDADYEVLPAFMFDVTNACISDATGTKDGSTANPYDVESGYCAVAINNETADIIVQKNGNLTISGTVHDSYAGKTVTISATVGGVQKTTNVSTPAMGTAWQLTWTWAEMSQMAHSGGTVMIGFTDGTKNGEVDYVGTITIDKTDPECGTWFPTEASWKTSPGGTEFTLTSSTDAGGAGLATSSATLVCTTSPLHGETCPVTIEDKAGNATICISPNNRVDIFEPNLQVTAPIPGWQGDKQTLEVVATDDQTSVARVAYSWSLNNLGSDCTGGTTISSGDDLRLTIMGGENTLYVCSRDVAGNVATFNGVYKYIPPVFAQPTIEKNVKPENLYWNIQSVSETQSYIEVKGFFPKTTGSYNYALEYIIPTIGKSYAQAIRTSPLSETHFTFLIPTSDFKASKENHTFSGPQKFKITDLDQMEATTIDHNLTFFFPIFQTSHRKDFNYFIFASDNRLNEVEE